MVMTGGWLIIVLTTLYTLGGFPLFLSGGSITLIFHLVRVVILAFLALKLDIFQASLILST